MKRGLIVAFVNELALFAGVGGGLLASKMLGWRPVCAVEKESYCREVLLRRQRDGLLSMFPIWDDARTFDGRPWSGTVDIVTAGFPCQPFSVAGKRKGVLDERNLWPDTIRIIREVGPIYCFLENVPGLIVSGYFGTILQDLAQSGYDVRWCCLSALKVGAPHKRRRLWIFADAMRDRWEHEQNKQIEGAERERATIARNDGQESGMALTKDERLERHKQKQINTTALPRPKRYDWWSVEPDVGRVAHGVAHRVDRLKAIGNGIVPQTMVEAWKLLIGDLCQ